MGIAYATKLNFTPGFTHFLDTQTKNNILRLAVLVTPGLETFTPQHQRRKPPKTEFELRVLPSYAWT